MSKPQQDSAVNPLLEEKFREDIFRRTRFNGYEGLPLVGKAIFVRDWQTVNIDLPWFNEGWNHTGATNIGLRCGGFSAFDIDIEDAGHTARVIALIEEEFGLTPLHRRGKKGMALGYRNRTPIKKIRIVADNEKGKVEILGARNQLACFGPHPDTGRLYQWMKSDDVEIMGCNEVLSPLNTPLDFLPEVTPERLRNFAKELAATLTELGYGQAHVSGDTGEASTASAAAGKPVAEKVLREELSYIKPDTDRDTWRNIIAAIRATNCPTLDEEELFELADEWSRGALDRDGRFKERPPKEYRVSKSGRSLLGRDAVYQTFWTMPPKAGGIGHGTLARAAKDAGWPGHPSDSGKTTQENFGEYVKSEQQDECREFTKEELANYLIPSCEEKDRPKYLRAFLKDGRGRGYPLKKLIVYVEDQEHSLLWKIPAAEREAIYKEFAKSKGSITIGDLTLTPYSEIKNRNTTWLRPDEIPAHEITLFAGAAKDGKTTIVIDLVARITRGELWPLSVEHAPCGTVIYLSAEDSSEETIGPRLTAAGANRDLVFELASMTKGNPKEDKKSRMVNLVEDIEAIKKMVQTLKAQGHTVRAVVIDPLNAFLGGKKHGDSWKTSDMRAILGPISEFVHSMKIAVLAITHFNKDSKTTNAINRIVDSGAITAVARAIWVTSIDRDEDNNPTGRRVFLPAAVQNAATGEGYVYQMETKWIDEKNDDGEVERIKTSGINWIGRTTQNAYEALAAEAGKPTDSSKAKIFLQHQLANGPRKKEDILEAARSAGFKDRTIERAKTDLGLQSKPDKPGPGGKAIWSLPGTDPAAKPKPKDDPTAFVMDGI